MGAYMEPTRRELLAGSLGTLVLPAETSRAAADDNAIVPFTYRAADAALADLRRRLEQTRWPENETAAGWEQGPPLTKLQFRADHAR